MIRELMHRRRMRKLTRQMDRAAARERHPSGQHPTPEQIDAIRDMVHTMAGMLVHFATTPGVFPQFVDFLRAEGGLVTEEVSEQTIYDMLRATHDMLAPGCPDPIEAS